MKIFPTAQVLWALSLSLLVCLFLSTAICFLSCFFLSICLFLVCSCSWNLGCDCSFSCHLELLHLPGDVRVVVSYWPLLFTSVGWVSFCGHSDQFPLGRAHPLQVVFRWWFMLLTGSFWSPLVTCKDVAGRPSVSRGRARCLTWYFHPHLHLSLPEDTCTMWNVKEIILCEKKPVCTVLGISSSGWGFERRLVTVEASIYESHCCFLSVLHQLLVLALRCVAPPPVILLEQSRHQPHVPNVKTSIPRPAYSRSLQNVCSDRRWGLHREQHLGLRSVT